MAKTYYAKIKIAGAGSAVPVQTMANNFQQAKKMIEAQYGKVKWVLSPSEGSGGKPPSWFK